MTITGTQTTAALPAASQAAGAAATPAHGGDHGVAAPPVASGQGATSKLGFGAMPPFYDPYARIRQALQDLMNAIRLLQGPPVGPPPYDPGFPPFDPGIYPPLDPHIGCPHMPQPPIDPWYPPTPPAMKPRPEVGDTVATAWVGKSLKKSKISVQAVYGSYSDRAKAVAAAKHLAGIHGGDTPFGVVKGGLPGQERYVVVRLNKNPNLTPNLMGNVAGRMADGWSLDTVAFDAKTAKRVTAQELTPEPYPPVYTPFDRYRPLQSATATPGEGQTTGPDSAMPPAADDVPAPQPHAH
jgi:hypothetical protein